MAKLNIPRLPGESDLDFKRRYGREQMRAYRAAHPSPKKEKPARETKPRKNSPFSLEEWEALQRKPGESAESHKARNDKARHEKYDARHPGRLKARAKKWYDDHTEEELERGRRYREGNPERVRASQKAYCDANKEKRVASNRAWITANPEKRREQQRLWLAANPGLNAHYSAKWRESCRVATPAWADMVIVRRFYEEARRISDRTGTPHEVDHIVPVQGKLVRGLHVETNLRIIPALENSTKLNRFDEHLLWVLTNLAIW